MEIPIVRRRELTQLGFSSQAKIARAIQSGELTRLKRDVYYVGKPPPVLAWAANHKVQLGCLTACNMYGLWLPKSAQNSIHVSLRHGATQPEVIRTIPSLCKGRVDRASLPICTLEEALEQVARRHDAETALIVLESAISNRKIAPDVVREMLGQLPAVRRATLAGFSTRSESGSETRIAHFLRSKRIPFKQQIEVVPYVRVDFLVGQSLIVECDSFSFHAGNEHYEVDRRRDSNTSPMGYVTARFSYNQIWHKWAATQETILGLVRMGRHRLKVRSTDGWD